MFPSTSRTMNKHIAKKFHDDPISWIVECDLKGLTGNYATFHGKNCQSYAEIYADWLNQRQAEVQSCEVSLDQVEMLLGCMSSGVRNEAVDDLLGHLQMLVKTARSQEKEGDTVTMGFTAYCHPDRRLPGEIKPVPPKAQNPPEAREMTAPKTKDLNTIYRSVSYVNNSAEAKQIVEIVKESLPDCPSCAAQPGHKHRELCTIERCSVCGLPARMHLEGFCPGHDKSFSRWTGFEPGLLEAENLKLHPQMLDNRYIARMLFAKPIE